MQAQHQAKEARRELAPEGNMFLVTGELPGEQRGQRVIALGYVIADDAQQAVEEQAKAQPALRVTGVASLSDLKRHVEMLEEARAGRLPALVCGSRAAP